MSKHISDFDIDNLSDADHEYFNQRPWLKTEYRLQTGEEFPEKDEDDSSSDEDGDPADAGTEGGEPGDEPGGDDDEPYSEWEYNDLQKEISARNEDRDEDSKIVPTSRSTADLIAALEADDEASDE